MDKILVKKAVLLEKLITNRSDHKEIFLEALEGFRKAVIREFERRLELAKANKKVKLYLDLEQPQDMTKEYDRVIGMLDMHIGDDIEVTAKEYQNYVQDDWSWSNQFYASNSAYSARARGKMSD